MSNRTRRSARKELKGIIECALAKEQAIPDEATRRVVRRILRQFERIAEISEPLTAAQATAAAPTAIPREEPPPPAPAFDPYAIGAVVTLQRLGPKALLDRLSSISSVENLRSLAAAQNLSVRVDGSSPDELRAAIVRGAEQRIAERQAAAS